MSEEPTLQNGNHAAWKQRCVVEEKHLIKFGFVSNSIDQWRNA